MYEYAKQRRLDVSVCNRSALAADLFDMVADMSQTDRVKEYLESGHTLNRLDGWSKLGILELPARICELRKAGMPINTKRVTVTNRYGERVSVAEWGLYVEGKQGDCNEN